MQEVAPLRQVVCSLTKWQRRCYFGTVLEAKGRRRLYDRLLTPLTEQFRAPVHPLGLMPTGHYHIQPDGKVRWYYYLDRHKTEFERDVQQAFVTAAQLAKIMGISKNTLRDWYRKGVMDGAFVKAGPTGRPRFKLSAALERLRLAGRVPGAPPSKKRFPRSLPDCWEGPSRNLPDPPAAEMARGKRGV
jgi:hypothetical protein